MGLGKPSGASFWSLPSLSGITLICGLFLSVFRKIKKFLREMYIPSVKQVEFRGNVIDAKLQWPVQEKSAQ